MEFLLRRLFSVESLFITYNMTIESYTLLRSISACRSAVVTGRRRLGLFDPLHFYLTFDGWLSKTIVHWIVVFWPALHYCIHIVQTSAISLFIKNFESWFFAVVVSDSGTEKDILLFLLAQLYGHYSNVIQHLFHVIFNSVEFHGTIVLYTYHSGMRLCYRSQGCHATIINS